MSKELKELKELDEEALQLAKEIALGLKLGSKNISNDLSYLADVQGDADDGERKQVMLAYRRAQRALEDPELTDEDRKRHKIYLKSHAAEVRGWRREAKKLELLAE